jgi:hypothetical protein
MPKSRNWYVARHYKTFLKQEALETEMKFKYEKSCSPFTYDNLFSDSVFALWNI